MAAAKPLTVRVATTDAVWPGGHAVTPAVTNAAEVADVVVVVVKGDVDVVVADADVRVAGIDVEVADAGIVLEPDNDELVTPEPEAVAGATAELEDAEPVVPALESDDDELVILAPEVA